MGGEGQFQEKAAGKPTVRKRAKNAFRKALPILVPIVFVGGITIGAGVRGCIAKQHEKAVVRDLENRESRYSYDMKNKRKEGMRELNEITQMLIKNNGQDSEELLLALEKLNLIVSSYRFDMNDAGLLKAMVQNSGANAPYSLDILARIFEVTSFNSDNFDWMLVERILSTVNTVANKSGQDKKEVFKALLDSASITYYYNIGTRKAMPLDMLNIVETIAENSTGKDDILYKAGLIAELSRKNYQFENPGETARKVCETVNILSLKAGNSRAEALNLLRKMWVMDYGIENQEKYLKRMSVWLKPGGMLDAVNTIANRSTYEQRLIYSMKMVEAMRLHANPEKFNTGFAGVFCDRLDKITLPLSFYSRVHAFEILSAMLGNEKFDFEKFSDENAVELGRTLSATAVRAGNTRTPEAMKIIKEIITGGVVYFSGKREFRGPDPIDAMKAIKIMAEKSADPESFIRNLKILKADTYYFNYSGENDYAFLAGKLFELEKLVRDRSSSQSALKALSNLESGYFSLGMVKLAEIAIGDARGNEVSKRLELLRKTLNSGKMPFMNSSRLRAVDYDDYEEGYALVRALFQTDIPNMEKLINFSYGVSVLGKDKTDNMYKVLGMEYFFRYPPGLLQETSKNSDPKQSSEKPLALALFAKSDWNNNFYGAGGEISPLMKYYRVLIVETDSDLVFYSKINEVAGLYGKISVLAINGHGSPGGVTLGQFTRKTGTLSYLDDSEVSRLQDSFVKNPIVVFNSCSTGKHNSAIGGVFSKLLGAKVFAPIKIVYYSQYIVDGEGKLLKVCYSASTREYSNGSSKILPVESCTKK